MYGNITVSNIEPVFDMWEKNETKEHRQIVKNEHNASCVVFLEFSQYIFPLKLFLHTGILECSDWSL